MYSRIFDTLLNTDKRPHIKHVIIKNIIKVMLG